MTFEKTALEEIQLQGNSPSKANADDGQVKHGLPSSQHLGQDMTGEKAQEVDRQMGTDNKMGNCMNYKISLMKCMMIKHLHAK